MQLSSVWYTLVFLTLRFCESISGYLEPFPVPLKWKKQNKTKFGVKGKLQSAWCWANTVIKYITVYWVGTKAALCNCYLSCSHSVLMQWTSKCYFPIGTGDKYWKQNHASRTSSLKWNIAIVIYCCWPQEIFSVECQWMVVRSPLQPSLWQRKRWLLELCLERQVCSSQEHSPGSSLEHLQLIRVVLQLSSLNFQNGYTSFKEKVELSPYCPQRCP